MKQPLPSSTLHNTSVDLLTPVLNPLIGYSEGERQRKQYKE